MGPVEVESTSDAYKASALTAELWAQWTMNYYSVDNQLYIDTSVSEHRAIFPR